MSVFEPEAVRDTLAFNLYPCDAQKRKDFVEGWNKEVSGVPAMT